MAKKIQSITDLIPDAANANKGTERGRYAVEASLREIGAGRSIVVDKDGRIIAGNKTLEAWADISGEIEIVKTDGKKLIVVQREDLDLSDVEGLARKLAYYDNRAGQLGLEWDAEQLFSDLNAGVDLSGMFFDDEIADILATIDGYEKETAGEDPGADVSKADELQAVWNVQLGDLWQLGDHRLICGDCTDAATVARVMGGELFDLCITSPPYNSGNGGYKTDYNGKTKKFYQDDTDDRTEDEWVDFCETVLRTCGKFTRNDFSVVVWNVMYTARCRSGYGRSLFGGRQPFTVKETICWDKGAGFPTASKGILSRNWELVFVLSKGEKYNTTQGDNEPRWAKWDISRPTEQDESHKATYPVDLPIKAIQDFSYDDAIVYEPFSGSGTTIIACEQLGRKCRAVELHPPYVSVALERFFTMTGKTPIRLT